MTTWHAIYDVNTGELKSLGTVVSNPLPDGLASVPCGDAKPVGDWNAASLTFEHSVPDALLLPPQDFMARFTLAEETAIRSRAMTDPNMVTFLARVERARSVSLTHADTIAGMNYCVALGFVTAARKQEILNG